jgi:hypothetical protein
MSRLPPSACPGPRRWRRSAAEADALPARYASTELLANCFHNCAPNVADLRPLAGTVREMKPSRDGPVRRYLPGSPFNAPVAAPDPADSYEPRDLVSHDKYGLGRVLDVEGQTAIVVDFGTHRRRIALPCALLVKL